MTTPGVGQQAFDWYGGEFFDPTAGQNLLGVMGRDFLNRGVNERVGGDLAEWAANKGTQGDTYGVDYVQGLAGKTDVPGMIDEAWSNVKGLENDVSGFYDNAFNSAQRKLNRGQAARGRFDSSDAIRASAEQATDFAGKRAKDESEFRAKRAELMDTLAVQGTTAKKDWITGMGDLAFKAGTEQREYADTASQIADRAQASEEARRRGAFEAAFGVDQNKNTARATGMEAAFGAQDLHDNRAYKGLEYDILMGDKAASIYNAESLREAGLSEDQINAVLAMATDHERTGEAAEGPGIQPYVDSLNTTLEAVGRTRVGTAMNTPSAVQNPYAPNMSGGPATLPP
jgi:hypothetical protein